VALALLNLGEVAQDQGDYTTAQGLYEQCLGIEREIGDKAGVAGALLNLGRVFRDRGEYERSISYYEESLALYRELEDQPGISDVLNGLAQVAYHQGDSAQAWSLYEQSLALRKEQADRRRLSRTLAGMAYVALKRGDYARAVALFRESLSLSRELGNQGSIALSLEGLATVQAKHWPERAARLFGASEALRERAGIPLPPSRLEEHARSVTVSRSGLAKEVFAKAWAEGRALTVEQAIDLASAEISLPAQSLAPARSVEEDTTSRAASESFDLTKRELEVLRHLVEGLTDVQLAARLFVSPNTVHAHVHSIFGKLGVNSRSAAAHFAVKHGLV
jgi:DNA-binding CsgD family transcriptional regulator/tetratricopeptide (TPR) repeat protein